MANKNIGMVCIGLLASVVAIASAKEEKSDHKLKDFKFGEVVSGDKKLLNDLDNKVVVIEFWGTRCPPCIAKMPHLAELDKRYSSKGLRMIGAEVQMSDQKAIENVIERTKVKFPITKGCSHPLKFSGIPHMAIFNVDGEMVFAGYPSDEAERIIKKELKRVGDSGSATNDNRLVARKDLVAERDWTSNGKSVKARLVSVSDGKGKFIQPNGVSFEYAIKDLSAEDQEIISTALNAEDESI